MKKIVFVFIFFTLNIYCQNSFKFDLYTDYDNEQIDNRTKEKFIENTIVFCNSSNDNFYLKIHRKGYKSGKLSAILTDKKKNINHYFDIIENKESILSSESFLYKFSVQYDKTSCNNNFAYDTFEISDNQDYNAKIVMYDSKKKKKITSILFLKKSVSDKSYYTNFKVASLHHFDFCDRLKITNPNFLIESAAFLNNDNGKIVSSVKLMNYGNVDFNILINNKVFKNKVEMFNYLNQN